MKSLVLRTCRYDMTSHGGFRWPKSGKVTCSDWSPVPDCGNGLHGFLNGEGDGKLAYWYDEAKWLVLEVDSDKIVNLDGKVKFPEADVIFCGNRKEATDFLISKLDKPAAVMGAYLVGGDNAILTGGYRSTVTGGDCSTVTGGDYSMVNGGDKSTITGGDYSMIIGNYSSIVKGGCCSIVTGGYRSKLTGGDYSTLTGGDYSTIIGGDCSIVNGGYRSKLIGGNCSKVTGGEYSTVSGGYESILNVYYYQKGRTMIKTAYVGKNKIEADTPYILNSEFKFEKADL